ncbi:MAG: polysaccharide lyase 6 family protein [Bacteroides sp.]|nr:polysaccharide lyase 6 family protein [Bacteroides sp.]
MRKATLIGLLLTLCIGLRAGMLPVKDLTEFNAAVKRAQPGDTILLANGVWQDVKLVFKGEGTADQPIVLRAETPGQCTLEGLSNLRLSGHYLVVEGLVFVNGHTPTSTVVEFKTSATEAARHSVMRHCVIDGYNNPDKTKSDNWVNLCGQHNTVEYCYFGGKKNLGTTFIVSPNGEGHMENYHRIRRNHFGPRPRLGSNGGETLRIGTSTWSLENSNTIVEGNFFEHCNGEVEIISVKSCENRIIGNTFWECEGSLVLRHGNRNEVSGNYFLGNGKQFTGGIRVINEGHKVYNNYLYGLTGIDFRAPLVIMNGVPNSAINRYHQVKDVDIAFNTFVDCALPWQLCVGSDEERTSRPVNVRIANNIVYSPAEEELIRAFDRTDGFLFEGNVMQSAHGIESGTGFLAAELQLRRGAQGMILPLTRETAVGSFDYVETDIAGRTRPASRAIGAFELLGGAETLREIAGKSNCGPGFPWTAPAMRQAPAQVHKVVPGKDALLKAIRNSVAGDILELQEEGVYAHSRKIVIPHSLTIRAREGLAGKPVIRMEEVTANTVVMFELTGGSTVHLQGLELDGNARSEKPARYALTTQRDNNLDPYNLFVTDCDIHSFQAESGGAILKAYQTAFIDTLSIRNSVLRDSFRGLSLSDEKEDKGNYNAEYILLENTVFSRITQWAIDFYRGGNDESTLGGFLYIDHGVFDEVNNRAGQYIIRQTGLVHCDIRNTVFTRSAEARGPILLSGPHHRMTHCCIYKAGKPGVRNAAQTSDLLFEDPRFLKHTYYPLSDRSPLAGQATDGGDIGLFMNP